MEFGVAEVRAEKVGDGEVGAAEISSAEVSLTERCSEQSVL